jgi:glycine betaine/proline transport system substrate-binding protein
MTGVLLAGCGMLADSNAGEGKTLRIGYITWDENVANSNLVKVILEDEFGYERVELQLADLSLVFEGVAEGEVDAFLDVWMPNHADLLKRAGDRVEQLPPWYIGKTRYGIAVPDYMEDVRSIADLNDSGATRIHGIEPGAVFHTQISEEVIPAYGLELRLVESSTPAMLAELEKAYRAQRPFVFLAWSPHWMNLEYDFHYLEDPLDAQGHFDEPSKLSSIVRAGLAEDDPVAYALISNMRLTEDQVNQLELAIRKAGDPEEGARSWLGDNRDVVRPWIDAAHAAG